MSFFDSMQILLVQPWVPRLGWTLVHFLWQGAVIAALYAIARTSRSAKIRYVLACAALAAMAIAPAVTFSMTGQSDQPAANAVSAASHVFPSAPAVLTMRALATDFTAREDVMPWLVIAWLTGAIIFWMRLIAGWMIAARMRSTLVRPAPAEWQRRLEAIGGRLLIARPVKLLVSAIVQTPAVIGWLRPVVLMPLGALTGLPAEHVEALLAHELAHIRRHDYLINILQGIAEALLFYHPAVWWISRQIRNERELCCDDMAVTFSGDAVTYVRALADLEAQRPAHWNPALAANGGSLQDRIGRLLGVRSDARRTPGARGIAAGFILVAACTLIAQPSAPAPKFEVAAVKPSDPSHVGFQSFYKNDRYTAMTATVRNLVSAAYHLQDFQISGGPAWISSERYDISAKMSATPQPGQVGIMLQGLLADRFGLKVHRVTKSRPGYLLVIDKGGPKLMESKKPGPGLGFGRGRLFGKGSDMGTLAWQLSSQLEVPVAEKTGLKALYDFTLEWTPDEQAAESSGPSVFSALREQLGLRLEPVKKVPVDFFVIDRAQKPSEN